MVAVRSGAIRYEALQSTGLPPREIAKHLMICLMASPPIPVLLLGPPGLGKSALVRAVTEMIKRMLRVTRTYYYNPVDWRGAPIGDLQARVTRYLPPDFLLLDELVKDCPPMVWFFDDCNVAPASVQAVLYEVILERTVCGKRISDNVAFVAAGNRAEDRALTHEMSSALSTRFIRLTMRPDLDDWLAWADSGGVAPELKMFMKAQGTKHLYDLDPSTNSWRTPRTWEYVSHLIEAGAPVTRSSIPLYAGAVGAGGASEFVAYWEVYRDLPDANKIVLDGNFSEKAPDREHPDRLYAFSAMLAAAVGRAPEDRRLQAARNHISYVSTRFPGREFSIHAYKEMTRTRGYKQVHEPFIMSKEFIKFAQDVKEILGV